VENVIIRRFKEGDEREINDLFNQIFNNKRTLEEWYWKFRNNPLGYLNLTSVAESEGKILGQYSNLPYLFKYRDMILKFGMVVDNFVHPDFRGGIKGVQRATYEYACNIFYEENMAIGFGFPTRAHYIFGKRYLKYSDIGNIPVLFRRMNWRLSIKWRFPMLPSIVVKVVRDISNVVYRILISTINRRKPEGLKIKRYDSFDERFDEFWERVKDQYGIMGVRDQRCLSWRYKKPGNKYEIIVAELAGKIVGYAVLKTQIEAEQVVAYLVDILVDESVEAGPGLIKACLLRFLTNKVDYVLCWMLEDKKLYQTLKEYGFIEREIDEKVNGVYLIFDDKNIEASYIGNSANWYVTMGDSDVY